MFSRALAKRDYYDYDYNYSYYANLYIEYNAQSYIEIKYSAIYM